MELQFSDLGAARLVLRATSQALVEGELPLPEGRKSAEVLCVDGSVSVSGAAAGEGAVTVEGRVRVELICRDGDEVFAFASSAAFRHSLPAPGAKEGMTAEAFAALQSISVEQTGALMLSAVLDVECMVLQAAPLRVLAGIRGAEDLERREQTFETVRTDVLGQETVRIREEISAPNAAAVLRASGVCQLRETHVGGAAAISEGTLTVTALTVGADGKLAQFVQHVPVTLETEADGTGMDAALPVAEAEVEAIGLALPEVDGGMMSVEARIAVRVEALRKENVTLPQDAYAPSLPLSCVREEVQLLLRGETVRFRFGASETLGIPDGMPECYRVAYCMARPVVTSASIEDGRLTVEGLLFTRVLYQTEGGMLYAFTEDIPFRCENAGAGKLTEARAQVRVVSAAASGAGRGIELSYTLQVTAQPYAVVKTHAVTGMEECAPAERPRGVVIYFAGNGETLFDVGRRFNLPRKRLLEMNPGLSETLADGQKLVLLL